ncbi:MAG: hypothetical protein WBN27_15225 [Eudoraea sp.]|uniref:hypothetical protein n=1 Tax=Eudoraea sp. TaxID=1979955 RepID=UPI003C7485F4
MLQGQIIYNDIYKTQFEYAKEIVASNDHTRQDTLGKLAMNITSYSDFDREGNIYESMVNSGQIHLLRNQNIVTHLRIPEERYNYTNRMESIHYDAMMTFAAPNISSVIDFSTQKIMSMERIYTFEFQNLLISLLDIMQEKEQTYNAAITEIDEILVLIDEELKPN